MKTNRGLCELRNLLENVRTSRELSDKLAARNFAQLRYTTPSSWISALSDLQDDLVGEACASLNAFLLVASVTNINLDSWKLVGRVLPELRALTSERALPSIAEQILNDGLPTFGSARTTDSMRRILLSLAYLRVYNRDDGSVLQHLGLAPSEKRTIFFGIEHELVSTNRLMPWF